MKSQLEIKDKEAVILEVLGESQIGELISIIKTNKDT